MELHECLQSLFESKKATLSSISRLSDINKGTLHRIVYGKQDVKFDELMKISNALGLSLGERELLFDLYFDGIYGATDMEIVRYLIAEVPKAFHPLNVTVPEKGYDAYPKDGYMPTCEKVYEAIYTVSDIDSGKIYTNFSFKDAHLDEFFFRKAQKDSIELVHCVEKIQNGGERTNLQSLLRALRYMQIQQFPYLVELWQSGAGSQLLPYFVVTQKGAVLFNDTFGFITIEQDAVASLISVLDKNIASAPRLGSVPSDIMSLKNTTAALQSVDGNLSLFCKYPCCSNILKREWMYDAARDVPFKEQLIEICATHYEQLFAYTEMTMFTTLPGLEDFAKTGNFYQIPADFVHGFSPKVRIEFFEAMKKEIEKDRFFILVNPDAIPDGVTVECYANYTAIGGADTSTPDFGLGMQYHYTATDPFYVKIMKIMSEYLISSSRVYPKDVALRMINNCIALVEIGL